MGISSAHTSADRPGLSAVIALAACCAVPMLVILGATSVLGLSLGWAAAAVLAIVAAFGCAATVVRGRHAPHGRGGHHG